MSFLNIKDPEERDAVIVDYLALKKRLKERNMEEGGYLMDRRRDLEETFEPIMAGNENMAQDIIKDLAHINEELAEISRPKIGSKRRLVGATDYGPLAEAFTRIYTDDTVDKTFGICVKNGKFMIGNKISKIQGDNIVIGNEVYVRTPGLWTLITEKNPKEYDEEVYERYKELIYETKGLYREYDRRSSYPRSSIYNGNCLLLGARSPFRNIPILKWIL